MGGGGGQAPGAVHFHGGGAQFSFVNLFTISMIFFVFLCVCVGAPDGGTGIGDFHYVFKFHA